MKVAAILRQNSFFYGSVLGINPLNNELNYIDMINILNPYDECALILALEQKDLNPKVEVSVVVMDTGHDSSDLLIKGLNLGADCGILLKKEQEENTLFDGTACQWSKGLAAIDWQILLVGANKIDTQEDEFGVYLGEYLSLPVVSGVTDLQILSDKQVRCWRKLEKGNREIVESELPAILTVEQIGKVRYPTLKKIANPKEHRIRNLLIEKEQVQQKKMENKVSLQKYSPPRTRPKKGLFEINSNLPVSDRLTQLFTGGVSEKKKADELIGSPEKLAKNVLEYLIKKGVI